MIFVTAIFIAKIVLFCFTGKITHNYCMTATLNLITRVYTYIFVFVWVYVVAKQVLCNGHDGNYWNLFSWKNKKKNKSTVIHPFASTYFTSSCTLYICVQHMEMYICVWISTQWVYLCLYFTIWTNFLETYYFGESFFSLFLRFSSSSFFFRLFFSHFPVFASLSLTHTNTLSLICCSSYFHCAVYLLVCSFVCAQYSMLLLTPFRSYRYTLNLSKKRNLKNTWAYCTHIQNASVFEIRAI